MTLLVLASGGCQTGETQDQDQDYFSFDLHSPPHGETDVDPRVMLGWSIYKNHHPVNDPQLFFGTDPHPPFFAQIKVEDYDRYRPGPLEMNKTYYWKLAVTSPPRESGVRSFSVSRDRMVWSFSLGRGQSVYDEVGFPKVYGNKVYQWGTNGKYYCLDAASGTLFWTFEIKSASPAQVSWESAEKIYVSSGSLYCLDASTGAYLWIAPSPNPQYGWRDSLVIGDRIYCWINTRISCLDARSGNEIWGVDRIMSLGAGICFADGRIFFGSKDQNDVIYLECLDAATRSTVWKRDVGSAFNPRGPIVDGGRIYFGNGHTLNCFNAEDGQLVWKFSSSDNIGTPFAFNGRVFVSTKNNYFSLFDAAHGTVLWETETPKGNGWGYSCLNGDPVLIGNSLVFAANNGYVFSLDLSDGRILWKYFITPDMWGVAQFGKDIYIAGDDEQLHCLSTE